ACVRIPRRAVTLDHVPAATRVEVAEILLDRAKESIGIRPIHEQGAATVTELVPVELSDLSLLDSALEPVAESVDRIALITGSEPIIREFEVDKNRVFAAGRFSRTATEQATEESHGSRQANGSAARWRAVFGPSAAALIEARHDGCVPKVVPEPARDRVLLPEALQLVERQLPLVVLDPLTVSIKWYSLVSLHETS